MKRLHRVALATAAFGVAIAPGSWAQDSSGTAAQTPTITFKAPAERISVLLADLGKQAGVKLSAEALVGNEVMLLQAKDATLNDLMKRIAEASGAEWIKLSSGYRLSRPSELLRPQVKAEAVPRTAALTKALEPYVQALQDSGDGPQTNAGVKAIARLIQTIGIDEIAALPFDTRTVYSTSPTRSRLSLGNGAGQIILKYVQDVRAGQTSTDTQPTQGPGRRGRVAATGPGANPDLTPAKADLIVIRPRSGDVLNFGLIVGDSEGRLVARAQFVLALPPAPRDVADVAVEMGGDPLEMSGLALQFAKLMNTASTVAAGGSQRFAFVTVATGNAPDGTLTLEPDPGKTPDVDKDWRTRLSNPETNEPLALCAGEALGKAADAVELNIAAVLPDSALVPAARTVAGGGATAGAVLNAAQTDWGLKATKNGAWLVMRPRKQASSYNWRLDRAVLGKALRQLASAGMLSLDDRATYAAGEPIAPDGGNFEREYFRLLSASEANRLMSGMISGERKMLRFFASLTMFQRQALGSGRSVAISSFGLGQRDMLSDMVFNSMDGPTVGGAPEGPGAGRRTPAMRGGDMATERTELLPDGIPGSGVLTVQTADRSTIFGVTTSGEKIALGGPTIAFALNGGQAGAAGPTQYDLYVPGDRTTYTFVFQLLPNVVFRRTLTDASVDRNAKAAPYDQLPEDLRKRVDQMQSGTVRLNIVQSQSDGPVRP